MLPMNLRWSKLCVRCALVAAVIPRPAFAQDLAAAEALFREGKALLDKGDAAAACPKLAESQRLDPSSGTLLNLARCHEKEGKTATAWAEYLAALRLARTQNKPERVDEATRRISAIEGQLSYLTVRVTKSVPGIEIKRDEVVLAASSIGSKLPVDPGKHLIVVSAPGYEKAQLEVTIGVAGDSQTLVLPELRPAASAPSGATERPPVPEPAAATTPGPAATAPVEADQAAPGGSNTLAWVIGGAGVAFAGVGATFGVLALSAYGDADKACPSHQNCSHDSVETRSRAEMRANIANVGVGLGIVGIGVATVMLLTSGSSEPEQRSPTARRAVLVPRIGTHDAGLTFLGDF